MASVGNKPTMLNVVMQSVVAPHLKHLYRHFDLKLILSHFENASSAGLQIFGAKRMP
jgi:hypothetical protein